MVCWSLAATLARFTWGQHLDGSVMGHRWRCNADNGARYTGLQGRSSGMVTLDALRASLIQRLGRNPADTGAQDGPGATIGVG